jgi:ribosomal protein S18 acetylase RimI-like enzyme
VRLAPMTEAAYARYMETAVKDYAQAHVDAGDCDAEDALALAQADYDTLLPEGLRSKDNYLLSIHAGDSGEPVGIIWFAVRQHLKKKSAFIYDFAIRPEFRRKGYGADTLREVETLIAGMGIRRIGLNVMGWNHAARALYETLGYQVTGMGMRKLLE